MNRIIKKMLKETISKLNNEELKKADIYTAISRMNKSKEYETTNFDDYEPWLEEKQTIEKMLETELKKRKLSK